MKFSTFAVLCTQAIAVFSVPTFPLEPKFTSLAIRSAEPIVNVGQSFTNAAASALVGTAVNMALKPDDRKKAGESIAAGGKYAKECFNCAVEGVKNFVRGGPKPAQHDIEMGPVGGHFIPKPSRIPKYVGRPAATGPHARPESNSRIPRPAGRGH